MTGLVVLWPVILSNITLGLSKPDAEVLHPLLYLVWCLENERANEATEVDCDLSSVYNNALNWSVEGYLTSDSI